MYVGPIKVLLNGNDIETWTYHGKNASRNISVAVELGNSSNYLNDSGSNTLSLVNADDRVNVEIANLKITRVYGMCGLPCDNYPSESDCSGCTPAPSPECKSYQSPSSIGLDSTRDDHPCNLSCGNRSFTYFKTGNTPFSISPAGGTYSWYWINASNPSGNYVGSSKCIFNFNQCSIYPDESYLNDVPFDIILNNTTIATYYMSNASGANAFPSIDLCNSGAYNDNPGAYNTLTLKNRAPSATLITDSGGLNIYRVYRTSL
jgi:hypothetical protein